MTTRDRGPTGLALRAALGTVLVAGTLTTAIPVVRQASRTSPPAPEAAGSLANAEAVNQALDNLRPVFEPNLGQADPGAAFVARGRGYAVSLGSNSAAIDAGGSTLRMHMVGANPAATVVGGSPGAGKLNYYVGNDASRWRSNVSTYTAVAQRSVWPGIDVVWHGASAQGTSPTALEYDFVVAPGADPGNIAVAFEGASRLRLDKGALMVITAAGEARHHAPSLYQDTAAGRRVVSGRFVVDNTTVRFAVGDYDATLPLVIDPVLEYSTYLGGSWHDRGRGIDVDASGNVYVTGGTCSKGTYPFPTTSGAYQPAYAGANVKENGCSAEGDAFVTKLIPDELGKGQGLVYSTYLGGTLTDGSIDIAVDTDGSAYLTGFTISTDFPTTPGAYDTESPRGFLVRLDPSGSLAYASHVPLKGQLALGPPLPATPAVRTVWMVDSVSSSATPTTPNAFHTTCFPHPALPENCVQDVYVAQFNPAGGGASDFLYGTFLGGTGNDEGLGGVELFGKGDVAVDASGRAIVTGQTESVDFPMAGANGSFDTSCTRNFFPCYDAFVAVLDPTLPGDGSGVVSATNQQLVYSTHIGGSGPENWSFVVAAGPGGTIYLSGETSSTDFPVTAGAFDTNTVCPSPVCTGFVAKLDPALAGDGSGVPSASNPQLVYGTYLGGGSYDLPRGMAVEPNGDVWVAGSTASTTFPTKDPLQTKCFCRFGLDGGAQAGSDAFVSKLRPAGGGVNDLLFSTFLGGARDDAALALAVDSAGSVYLTGFSKSWTNSDGHGTVDRFPVTKKLVADPDGTTTKIKAFDMDNSTITCAGSNRLVACEDVFVSKISIES